MSADEPPTKRPRMEMSSSDITGLDEKALNRFSRQNAALGAETTAKLIKSKVLIFGLRGVGAETAKNLALQGVGAITIVDSNIVTIQDLGVNFFFQEHDLGQVRSSIVKPKLQELNPLCSVNVASSLSDVEIESFTSLVITQPLGTEELVSLNERCRNARVSFFYALTGGVSASLFVDHGPNHMIHDFDGEKPLQKLITGITQVSEEECLVRFETPEGAIPVSPNKGYYEITEVVGIDSVNDKVFTIRSAANDPVKTIRIPFKLSANDKYQVGGILTEKKLPTKHAMDSFATKLRDPGNPYGEPPTLVLTDLVNFGVETQLHLAFYAIAEYVQKNNCLPLINDDNEAEKVLEIAKALLSEKKLDLNSFDIDEDVIKRYSRHIAAEVQPMSAFIGGVLAQEVVKSTGKFTPIPGFFHFSAVEALPSDSSNKENFLPRGSQYDELATVFGWNVVDQLKKLRYFMVGCGALGCEFMKNFALTGICCSPEGKLVVTDADRIELSNLSRQFLFREHNVGQSKSKAAANMAKTMNPHFNVEALEIFVGAKSEETFDDNFWENLDGVCNALDNMEARLYVDRQCVKYEKSLLESGTMGTNGNVDSICPFKTKTYSEGGKAAEGGGVPMCTLRNFPHLTDHCIEWARDQFELLFVKLSKSLESYVGDNVSFENKVVDKASSEPGAAFTDVRMLTSFAKLASNPSIGTAAQAAFDIFHYLFRDRILDLQAAFPKDFRIVDPVTKQDKGPFWGEKKRYPTVATYNPQDGSHNEFLLSVTVLLSVSVGLIPAKQEGDDGWLQDFRNPEWIVNIASGLTVPPYVQAPVSAEGIENAPDINKNFVNEIIQGLLSDLRGASKDVRKSGFETIDFEKDDDQNFHISFVTATANLRCDNYSIKRTDFQSCKIIAGKIIAAIATTTAAVCGLVILELIKLVQKKETDAYMSRLIGLGHYTYTSFTADEPYKFKTKTETVVPGPEEPLPTEAFDETGKVKPEYCVKVVKRAYPEGHTVWDKIAVPGELTLKQFSEWLSSNHSLKMQSWDFVYGYRTVTDEDTKTKSLSGVSAPIYPIKPILNYSLLPSLDLTLAQANMAIMKNPGAKPTQQYIALWRECKAKGFIPEQPEVSDDVITESTTLREILLKMSRVAEDALVKGAIETSSISHITKRKFFLLSSSEVPLCIHTETEEEIEHLCALKIIL